MKLCFNFSLKKENKILISTSLSYYPPFIKHYLVYIEDKLYILLYCAEEKIDATLQW